MASQMPANGSSSDIEKDAAVVTKVDETSGHSEPTTGGVLQRDLKNRHMQMIAIGGAIGAGLFVGSGGALHKGGPASLVIGYTIIGAMLLMVTYALAEMAVLYPVNGAFYTYFVRFVDPSWGFAMGWQYAIAWLTVLPFELIAASLTIEFWRDDINMGVWVGVFMAALIIVQFFGVRGYGEVEFVLSLIKILACIGFMILGIVINCGGAGDKGYIGGKYWVEPGAFRNGFTGFCSVFVVAAFAFGGTEMVGLAAAESATPRKSIPQASKQVFFRIALFYIVNLFILGLILPSDDTRLLGSSGANTKASPFVLAIQDAGIKVLPPSSTPSSPSPSSVSPTPAPSDPPAPCRPWPSAVWLLGSSPTSTPRAVPSGAFSSSSPSVSWPSLVSLARAVTSSAGSLLSLVSPTCWSGEPSAWPISACAPPSRSRASLPSSSPSRAPTA
uniref:Amino acid permease/ SLC12A domain-containing protein n=1 Tax=Bionectria ochroleuca TaxID=29856 RepID=A0A8H7N8A4_BIOOC